MITSNGFLADSHERLRPCEIKNRTCKRAHKRVRIGVAKIRTFAFCCDSAYDSVACDQGKNRSSESRAEAEK